jgi:uncharacterized membrane protein
LKEFFSKYKLVIFAAIVLINIFFKSYKLGENSLWFDEAFSANIAQRTAADNIRVSLYEDFNPPLYGVVLSYWVKIFGDSEVGLRSLSVFASSLAAGILFLLCLNFFNWQTSVFASVMYLSSNDLFYYSQEARTYSLIIFFVLSSYYLYLSIIHRPTILKAVLFAVVNACIFYSHFLACLIMIGEAAVFPFLAFTGTKVGFENGNLTFNLKTKSKTIIYLLLSVILLCCFLWPWKDRTIFLLFEGGKTMWLTKPTFQEFKTCMYEFFNHKYLYQAYAYTAIAFGILLFFKKFREEGLNWKLILLAVIIGPGLMYLNYLLASFTPVFLKRYVLYSFLGFILIYSYLLSMLRFPFLIKLGLFLILSFFSFTQVRYPRPPYYEYNKAVPFLKEKQKDGTTLIINDMQDLFSYYYNKDIFHIPAYHLKHAALLKYDVYTPYNQTWVNDEDFSKYKDIYYTRSFDGYYDPQGNLAKQMGEKYKWIGDGPEFLGMKISHYTNPNYKKK